MEKAVERGWGNKLNELVLNYYPRLDPCYEPLSLDRSSDPLLNPYEMFQRGGPALLSAVAHFGAACDSTKRRHGHGNLSSLSSFLKRSFV